MLQRADYHDDAGLLLVAGTISKERSNRGPQLISSFDYDFNTSAVTTSTDPNNLQKTYGYDAAMRFNDETEPTGATVYTVFNDDNLTSTTTTTYTDAGVQKTITTTKTADGWGRVIQEVGANNGQVNTTYDAMGRVSSRTNPFTVGGQPGPSTSYTYDALGRTTEVTMPDAQKTTTDYNGSSVTITDPVNRKIQRQADGLGRLVTVNEQDASGALSQGTSYTYDLLNNLTEVNQGGQLRSFKYDALGRMLFERIPEQQATINDGTGTYWTTKFTYTSFNAVATRQDARGVISTYGYDTLHRLTQVSYNSVSGVTTTPTVSYVYDTDSYYGNSSNGAVVRVNVGSDFEERYSFDSNKRVSSMIRKLGTGYYTTSYQYNDINQVTRLTYPSSRAVTIGHDSRGRASGLTDVATGTNYMSGVAYNEAGQVINLTLGNGVVELYGYDANRLQMTRLKAGTVWPYTNRMNLTYGYQAQAGQNGAATTAGNTGQLISISGTINGTTESAGYTYDLQGRLATSNQTTNGTSAQRRFSYDRWGNRTGVWDATSGGNQIQSVSLQQSGGAPTNRLTSATTGGVTKNYTYDTAGNVTDDGTHTYTYDSENRLVSVDAGATAQYGYDHQNRRWKKVASGSTTLYMWEGSRAIAEHDGSSGAVVVDYIYSGSHMVAKVESGATRYFLSDRLSARVVMDGSGTVLGRQGHLPFGDELGASGTTDKHNFTSYERDDAGLDYAINRWYSPATGRFQSADPYRPSGGAANPQSWNRYSYTRNNPVNRTDQLGLEDEEAPGGGDEEEPITLSVTVPEYDAADNGYNLHPLLDSALYPRPSSPRQVNPGAWDRLRKYIQLRNGFDKFIDQNGCKARLDSKGWTKGLKDSIKNVKFYDLNTYEINSRRASEFFAGAPSNKTIGEFMADHPDAGWLQGFAIDPITGSPANVPVGIYAYGGVTAFFDAGQPDWTFLTHELLHYSTGESDEALAKALGATAPVNGSWSQAVSKRLAEGCQ